MSDYEVRYLSGDLSLPTLDRLMTAHPELFRGERPVCWSDFPEGWYRLIHEVCCGIESMLTGDELARFEVLQIKEKAGSLRFYYRFDRDNNKELAIREVLEHAWEASRMTCEVCGARAAIEGIESRTVALCGAHEFTPRIPTARGPQT